LTTSRISSIFEQPVLFVGDERRLLSLLIGCLGHGLALRPASCAVCLRSFGFAPSTALRSSSALSRVCHPDPLARRVRSSRNCRRWRLNCFTQVLG
jgi:hypothetical protein